MIGHYIHQRLYCCCQLIVLSLVLLVNWIHPCLKPCFGWCLCFLFLALSLNCLILFTVPKGSTLYLLSCNMHSRIPLSTVGLYCVGSLSLSDPFAPNNGSWCCSSFVVISKIFLLLTPKYVIQTASTCNNTVHHMFKCISGRFYVYAASLTWWNLLNNKSWSICVFPQAET